MVWSNRQLLRSVHVANGFSTSWCIASNSDSFVYEPTVSLQSYIYPKIKHLTHRTSKDEGGWKEPQECACELICSQDNSVKPKIW